MWPFYTQGDGVAGQIAPGSDDTYRYGGSEIHQVKLTLPLKKGVLDAHYMDNINWPEVKAKYSNFKIYHHHDFEKNY